VLAWGSDCPDNGVNEVTTTPAPFCDENGMTASGKPCQGKIKIKIQTIPHKRPCQTASGDDCEGEFKRKIRTTSEDKDGVWVDIKREMSQDGGKTWKPLPLLLSQLATFTHDAEETLPRECCVPKTSPTPAPLPPATTPGPIGPQDVTTTTQDQWGDEWGDDDNSGGDALRPQLVKEEALCGPRGELLTSTAGDISDCGALAEGAGYRAFAFGIKFARGKCYAMTLDVDDALCDEWDKHRANPRCPAGEWKQNDYFDFYALEKAWLD